MSYNKDNPFNELPDLPPNETLFETPDILKRLATASRSLGELNGLCASLPDPQILINTIVLQESKDSSAIENIVTTQDELYQANADAESATHAAKEVLSYREALYVGYERMASQQGLLLTNTLIEIVQTIKRNNAGIRNTPGTALKNAINGDVIYTPPCCEDVIREKLKALENFINNNETSGIDPLIKMALIHYQFEAIHPFADGNGRTGRILNALYLVQQGLLSQPVLYLSSYIVQHKKEYYESLRAITEKESWTNWVNYILTAIHETSKLTVNKIRLMLDIQKKMEAEMKKTLGNSFDHELVRLMFALPYLTIEMIEKRKLAHRQTASSWLKKLVEASIVKPEKRGRLTYYVNYKLMEVLTL